MGNIKPISPTDVLIDKPDFVIEAVNSMIKKNYRGKEFTFKAKDLILEARRTADLAPYQDWYTNKWMDFEDIYQESGWEITFHKSCYGDTYHFKPKKRIMTTEEKEVLLRLGNEALKAGTEFAHKLDVLHKASNGLKEEVLELLRNDEEFIEMQDKMDKLSKELGM